MCQKTPPKPAIADHERALGTARGARIAAACLQEGLIARAMPHGDILGFSPPLVMTEADAAEIVARARGAVEKVTDELARDRQLN